jgi:hypothetical protein
MMEAMDLIKLQIGLEYQLSPQGWLIPFAGSSEQAWYIVYRYEVGHVAYFNHRLHIKVRSKLTTLGPEQAYAYPGDVRGMINEHHKFLETHNRIYWSGYFSRLPQSDVFTDATKEDGAWVIKLEERVISRAISIRQNEQAAEAYVETQPGFKRRGFGRQVVAAWANECANHGQVPFYSYDLTNQASAALAKSLGVE